jgi:hypothetical protein
MPRTTHEYAAPTELVRAGFARFDQADHPPLAQGRAVVRTAVTDAEKFATDVENRDFAAARGDQHPLVRRYLVYGGNDMARHSSNL